MVGGGVAQPDSDLDENARPQPRRPSRSSTANLGTLWTLISATLGGKALPRVVSAHLSAAASMSSKEQMILDWQPAEMRFLRSRPRFERRFLSLQLIGSIDRAQEEILICNSYFVPQTP